MPEEMYKLPMPSNSLYGKVSSISGVLKKKDASGQIHELLINDEVFMGESVLADATSAALINYENLASIRLGGDCELDISDSSKESLLIWHRRGECVFEAKRETILSIRSLQAVFEVKSGSLKITMDDTSSKLSINASGSSVIMAYQDLDHNSYVTKVDENQQLVYFNRTRMLLKN